VPNTSLELESPTYRTRDDALFIQHSHHVGYKTMQGFHLHDSYEIFYLVKGERVYFINDRVYTAKQGDIVIINPYVLHRTTTSSAVQEYERILLNFKAKFVNSTDWPPGEELLPFAQRSCMIRFSEEELPEIDRMIWKMLVECKEQHLGYEAYVKSSLTKLLVQIRRQDLQKVDNPQQFAHPMHKRISEIVAFLNRNYREKISLTQVAHQFHISPYYLCRIFNKLTGFHFREYLLAVRVKEAQMLLRESEDKIITIAQNVGFEHVTHFNTTFKKMLGITPLKYRKLYFTNKLHQDK
jgi:AraC family transcriptional regulator of arabinose operon